MPEAIYLDNNATTRPDDEVVESMTECLRDGWANPSSVHRAGQDARRRIELARESVCELIGCQPRELIFNSGGTEGANHAIRTALTPYTGKRCAIVNRIEHSATRETAEALERLGIEVCWLSLDRDGRVDVVELEHSLAERGDSVGIVSLQWVNNETGAIQPVEAVGRLCRSHGVRFHCDGTQWVGKMPTCVHELPIDLMSFSAHKFHGPKGVGALYVRRGMRMSPEIVGGPQERERRGGTENTPGIVGMGVAARIAAAWVTGDGPRELQALRDRFERAIVERIAIAEVNQGDVPRIWNTSNIAFDQLEAEAILLLLSERSVYASAGAACSSGSLDPSPVLLAMGVPSSKAHGSVRFSLSRMTTEAEIERAIEIVPSVIERLQTSMAPV